MLVQGFSHLVGEKVLECIFMISMHFCMPSKYLPLTMGVSWLRQENLTIENNAWCSVTNFNTAHHLLSESSHSPASVCGRLWGDSRPPHLQ